jgi:hypothetical protein
MIMTGRERNDVIEVKADRILADYRTAAAYAAYVEAQLCGGRRRSFLALLGKIGRFFVVALVIFLSAGVVLGPIPVIFPE